MNEARPQAPTAMNPRSTPFPWELVILGVGALFFLFLYATSLEPHPLPESAVLIDRGHILQTAVAFSQDTTLTPTDWEWRADARRVLGPDADRYMAKIEKDGVLVDSSRVVREAGAFFAVVGEKYVVLLRASDLTYVVFKKEAFYSSTDKLRLVQETAPW